MSTCPFCNLLQTLQSKETLRQRDICTFRRSECWKSDIGQFALYLCLYLYKFVLVWICICIHLYLYKFVFVSAWWRNKKLPPQYSLFLASKHIPTLGLLKCYHLFAFTISCQRTNTITWEKDSVSKKPPRTKDATRTRNFQTNWTLKSNLLQNLGPNLFLHYAICNQFWGNHILWWLLIAGAYTFGCFLFLIGSSNQFFWSDP